ncbi:long-chain-fatty-acid--CoA ligase [Bacillus sp. V3B]|uniref:long-chain-fatty-acid--CoA ligase n=1 Tax=Bacillus sp. V3B TaxID=2804915 RepID=UPI00210D0923|nr:long-chain-fatty-acid--CoA ligase [Bacillus sp. V3B]MCQ6275494.1 long-chain-fatty-acid--CoA ligase [Bacillus sp. V3B]
MKLTKQLSIIAANNPGQTAFIYQHQETSYGELERQVNTFALGLERLGYQKGDHIALVAWNSPLYVIALYGILRMGAVVVPIKPVLTANEMKYVLHDGNVKAIVAMDSLLDKFEEMAEELPRVRHYIIYPSEHKRSFQSPVLTGKLKSFTQLVKDGDVEYIPPLLDEKDTAIILYTSGTTGKPKGTMLSYESIYANAKITADYLKYNENDRVISVLPMAHVFCFGAALCSPLLKGVTLLIMPKFSPKEVFRIAKQYHATVFAGVPTMYNYLLQTVNDQPMYKGDFSGVRLCLSGGASIPLTLLKKFEKTFHVTITEGYGLTEAAPVTYNPVDHPPTPGSIGKIVPHVECKIVDESGKEVRMGEVGELLVKGPHIMKGYYKKPEETAATLKDSWLYTGDLVRMDQEGYFYIVDRKKDVIIINGYNVYPKEVEEILYTHSNVIETSIVGTPHPETGEAIIGFVVVNNLSITEETLIEFCTRNLAKYKVPYKIQFLDKLPKNSNGKIDKKRLLPMISDQNRIRDIV